MGAQVGVQLIPLVDGRHNAHGDNLVAQCAEVLVAALQLGLLGGCALDGSNLHTVGCNLGFHSHHDVVETVVVYVSANGPAEFGAAHGCGDHLDREISRRLERAAAAEVDDGLATLHYAHAHCLPLSLGKGLGADDGLKGLAVDTGCGSEHCHLLAVTAVGAASGHLVGSDVEVLGQLVAQTCAVEGGEGGNLVGFQARVEQSDQAGDVGGVEDHYDVLHIGAIFSDILAKLLGDSSIAFEEVLAGHAGLTGSATRVDDVLGTGQSLGDVGGVGEVQALETALKQLLGHALQTRSIGVVEAYVGCKTHHDGCLGHVATDHAGCADNHKLVISENFHSVSFYNGYRWLSVNDYNRGCF